MTTDFSLLKRKRRTFFSNFCLFDIIANQANWRPHFNFMNLWLFVPIISVSPQLVAQPYLSYHADHLEFANWQANNININGRLLSASTLNLQLTVDQIINDKQAILTNIKIHCPETKIVPPDWQCGHGTVSFVNDHIGQLKGDIQFLNNLQKQQINLSAIPLDQGQLNITFNANKQGGWDAKLQLQQANFKLIKQRLSKYFPKLELLESPSGTISNLLIIKSAQHSQINLENQLKLERVSFNGPHAAQDLTAIINLTAVNNHPNWDINSNTQLQEGELYFEAPFQIDDTYPGFTFIPTSNQAIELDLQGNWNQQTQQFTATNFNFLHPAVFRFSRSYLNPNALPKNYVTIDIADAKQAFSAYMQPFLISKGLGDLKVSGAARATLDLQDEQLDEINLSLKHLTLIDAQKRFKMLGLSGNLRWSNQPTARHSHLQWTKAGIYRLKLGAGSLNLITQQGEVSLSHPAHLPILDGKLRLNALHMANLGNPQFKLELNAEIEPFSLPKFCKAVGWPLMAGKFGARLPALSYSNSSLQLGGALIINAFDGNIFARKLILQNPFGLVPTFTSDIEVDNIDLHTLTKTFSFGAIEGKLAGIIDKLRLEDWQPVGFNAELATPKSGNFTRRISQKAIDNLTALGGGMASNLVSRTVLSAFKSFNYERLGIKCRLMDGVCLMDGVEPTSDGYYIIKHGLIPPWIDVKGYNHQVDWQVLLERLQAIRQTQGAVIEKE